MDQELSYPLYISVNLLVVSPNKIGRESSISNQVNASADDVNGNERKVKSTSGESNISSWSCLFTNHIAPILWFYFFFPS